MSLLLLFGLQCDGRSLAPLQASLQEKDAEILRLREELQATANKQDAAAAAAAASVEVSQSLARGTIVCWPLPFS